jgi:Icc-related predicted phosphoesterase
MKFLVVGDLHGQKPKIHFKDFDAIIAPGDFCSDEATKYIFANLRRKKENPDYLKEWYDEIGRKKAKKMLDNAVRDGRKILEFLNSLGKPVFLVPGNHEQTGHKEMNWKRYKQNNWSKLKKGLKNLIDVHNKLKKWKGINFIGYGIVSGPEYPPYKEHVKKKTKKELKKSKEKYEREMKRFTELFKKTKNPVIFMPHNVPFNTKLDKVNNLSSPVNDYHFGSVVARKMIDKFQPLLCIGGHMHEHFGKCKIGKTTVINAGFGSKVNTLIDLDEKKSKIRSIKFYPKTYG